METEVVAAELERIRKQHGGLLRPADVVKAARHDTSPLHSKFEWDDSAAAEQYRLWQARELIVTVMVTSNKIEHQAYMSIRLDRKKSGGGYRAVADMLSDEDMRAQLLAEALADLEIFRRRYNMLKALVPVFAAIDEVRKQSRKK